MKPSDSVANASHDRPVISLVICTRNRAQFLPSALASLRRLVCRQPWELLLVDSASTDETSALLKNFSRDLQIPVTVLRSERPGLSIARNLGWRAARGEIVAFTDDDCYPSADFLDAIGQTFEQHPSVAYLGGRVLLHDPADLPTTIQTLNEARHLAPRSYVESGFIQGANFAMKRALIERLHGFDNRLGAGAKLMAGEDTDILVRASASGATGRYEPAIVVDHHHRRQKVDEVRRMDRGYAIGRGAYHAKAMVDATFFDRSLKLVYLRHWYWSVRAQLRDGKTSQVLQEFSGVAQYLWMALTQGRHVAD